MKHEVIAAVPQDSRPDGLPVPRRYYAAAAVWLAIAMSVLDSAIANIALPTIAAQLHAAPAASIWVINAYQLAITVLLLPLAALGDRIGHVRVYLPALGVFIAGSLACALARNLPGLIAARMFQGIGAAGIMSMNAALVRAIYPAPLLGRGMGYNALVLSVSAAVGPTVASRLAEGRRGGRAVGLWHQPPAAADTVPPRRICGAGDRSSLTPAKPNRRERHGHTQAFRADHSWRSDAREPDRDRPDVSVFRRCRLHDRLAPHPPRPPGAIRCGAVDHRGDGSPTRGTDQLRRRWAVGSGNRGRDGPHARER